jgi:hypothetical protein
MKLTDQRSKVLLEVLSTSINVLGRPTALYHPIGGMRVVKYFSFEVPFLKSEVPYII